MLSAGDLERLSLETVRVATLVEFRFDPPTRLWNGPGPLIAGGHEWKGFNALGQIDGLVESRSGESSQVRFTLSGTDAEMNRLAMRAAAEQAGALAIVYQQLFDEDWQTVGVPLPVWMGLTQPMSATSTAGEEGTGNQRSLTLPAENLFSGRSRPPAGTNSDRDQKTRFAGDKFLEFQPRMRNFTYVWP